MVLRRRFLDPHWQAMDCAVEEFLDAALRMWQAGISGSEGAAGPRMAAEDHFGMLEEIAIDGEGGLAVFGGQRLHQGVPRIVAARVIGELPLPAAQGGRERVDEIAGRVSGARPGQQIVVYARSGPWWVQPWPDKPFIPIKADGTWSTPTHLGFEYAALLVDPGYHPPPTIDTAPMRAVP